MRIVNYIFTNGVKRIILHILLLISCDCYCQTAFVKQWSPPGNNTFFSFVELPDSTFILGGGQNPNASGWGNALIMRCNINGDSLYTFKYDSGAIGAMVLLNDSEILVTGMVNAQGKTNIVKVNVISGDTSYVAVYPFSVVIPYIYRCSDDGYICMSWNGGSNTFIKLDSNYNIEWNQPGWNMSYGANQIKPDPGGGYVAVGNAGYVSDPYTVERFDSAGNIVWHYGYGNIPFSGLSDIFDATDVVISDDSNYIVSCKPGNFSFLKVNRLNGDTIWTKEYGNKTALLLNYAGNDTYITVTDSFGLIDGNGNFIWQTPIVPQDFIINHGAKTLDGGFAFCGRDMNIHTMIFVKLDSMGNTVYTELYDIEKQRQIYFYPNPVSDVLNFSGHTASNFTFSVYNFSGSKVIEVKNKSSVDVSALPAGFFLQRLERERR